MKDSKIVLKQGLDRERTAAWLEDVAAAIRSGGVAVKSGEETLKSSIPQMVRAEVEAKRKKGIFKFALEISWPETEEAAADLTIEPVEGPIVQGPGRLVRAVEAQKEQDQAPLPATKGQSAPAKKSDGSMSIK